MNKWFIIDEKIFIEKTDELKKLNEILIVYNKKTNEVIEIFNNGGDLIKFLIGDKELLHLKDYMKYNLLEFSDALIKETCKYRSFNKKFQIFKYTILQKMLIEKKENNKSLNSYLFQFVELKKSKLFQKYFRKEKIERLIK